MGSLLFFVPVILFSLVDRKIGFISALVSISVALFITSSYEEIITDQPVFLFHIGGGVGLFITAYTFGTLRELIFEEIRKEEIINQSRDKYKKVIDHIREGMIIVDNGGIVTFLNKAAASILGISVREYMHPKRGKRKIFVAATPFTDHNGVIHGSIGFLTDVTDNEKKKAHIEALSRRNDYLVAEMQHRIGNSLAVLKAFLNFYLSAKKINGRDGLEKLDDIIDTMSYIYMAFSRNFTVQTIMLPDYFQGITWDLIHKYRCNLRPIVAGRENFEIHIDRALPLGFLYTILISNIIKKASKAGTEGSLSIKLDTVEDKNKTVIEIALLGTTGKEAMFIHKTKSFEKEIVATLLSQIRGKMLTEKGKGKIRLEF
jgi:two-component sensor histidine kinase